MKRQIQAQDQKVLSKDIDYPQTELLLAKVLNFVAANPQRWEENRLFLVVCLKVADIKENF